MGWIDQRQRPLSKVSVKIFKVVSVADLSTPYNVNAIVAVYLFHPQLWFRGAASTSKIIRGNFVPFGASSFHNPPGMAVTSADVAANFVWMASSSVFIK